MAEYAPKWEIFIIPGVTDIRGNTLFTITVPYDNSQALINLKPVKSFGISQRFLNEAFSSIGLDGKTPLPSNSDNYC